MTPEHKKYTACKMVCYANPQCVALRGTTQCHDCPWTIPCIQNEEPGRVYCDRSSVKWKESLPCKCPVVEASDLSEEMFPPQGGTGQCFRCGFSDAVRSVHYDWELKIGHSRTLRTVHVTCRHCGLDVEKAFR